MNYIKELMLLISRLVNASSGLYKLRKEDLEWWSNQGFDMQLIRTWKPTEKDGRRLKQVSYLITHALQNNPANKPENKIKIHEQLQGIGVWPIFRQLIDASLNELAKSSTEKCKPGNNRLMSIPGDGQSTARNENCSSSMMNTKAPACGSSLKSYPIITIYIDEAWPGAIPNATRPRHEGVIAGIVCPGKPGSVLKDLPKIPTHLYKNTENYKSSLISMLECKSCFPFILPVNLAEPSDQAIAHYDELLHRAIQLLLGWVLPKLKNNGRTHVSLIFERISGHVDGDDHTGFIKGLLANKPKRYDQWIIDCARWEHKEYGYIPYADLIAHLTLEHTELNRSIGRIFDYKKWPGYIPFSLDFVPRLERLEHIESVHNVDDILDFARDTANSRFGQLIMNDIAQRLEGQNQVQERLLDALEKRYQNKLRDLSELRRLFRLVKPLVKELPSNAAPRLKLLKNVIALQDANHDGDPERIKQAVQSYIEDRLKFIESERELCAYVDLNLAVHYSDRFEFGQAETLISEWVNNPLFAALSPHQRGRLYSGLGQYKALLNDPTEASTCFQKALDLFAHIPDKNQQKLELDQTSVYLAINALEVSSVNAIEWVERVTGPLPEAALNYAFNNTLDDQYRHHLLVRTLYQSGLTTQEAKNIYMSHVKSWQVGWPQHPWPLIHLYRALLLWRDGDASEDTLECSKYWFICALKIIKENEHGATIQLIGSMIATVAYCCFKHLEFEEYARTFLDGMNARLPGAEYAINALLEGLNDPQPYRINEILATLPFNYH